MPRPVYFVAAAAALLSLAAQRAAAQDLRNWFEDPFFQISDAVPRCPEPAGPRVSEAERRVQAHRRAEKGTTCWLARECERPSAYAYDRDIASGILAAMRTRPSFPDTSLWVTVQGRVVYIEGCIARQAQAAEIEAFIRQVPHVQQAIAIVTTTPAASPPYKLLTGR